MSANRISRWALTLTNYDYDIKYRNTKEHANADMLSRFPRSVPHKEGPDEFHELFSVAMEESYLDARLVAKETRADPILSKVAMYVLDGWPQNLDSIAGHDIDLSGLKCYWNRREQLTLEQGCVTWGNRVIIPQKLRKDVLAMIHATHVGQVGMKSLARSYVYWPKIDEDIDTLVKTCEACGKHGKSLPKVMDHPWVRSTKPWQRIHIDYAGEFLGKYWLLVVDSYSKWPEVVCMGHNTTAAATTRTLRSIFSRTGLPNVVVSDNGPQFASGLFAVFMRSNKIRHILCPTYSPKSNGLVERLVQTFKTAMKKMRETSSDLEKNLANFLLAYRNTPHSTTQQPPAVMYQGRTLRSKIHQLRPSDQQQTNDIHPERDEKIIENIPKERMFTAEQPVWVQPNQEKVWQPAVVIKQHGNSPVYDLKFNERIITKHADKIKNRIRPVINLQKQTIPEDQLAMLRSKLQITSSMVPESVSVPGALASSKPKEAIVPSATYSNKQAAMTPSTGTLPVTSTVRQSERLKNKPRVRYSS